MAVQPAPTQSARSSDRALWVVIGLGLAITVAMLALATRFRPISDDYIHIGRVLDLGVVGSTADWFVTLLPGVPGVLTISLFAWFAGLAPWSLAYVPYTLFLCSILYLLGAVFLRPLVTREKRRLAWLLAVVFPPLWFLSIGNLFPQHDVINAFGMLSWISNGYRVHLPLLILIFFFAMNRWAGQSRTGFWLGLVGSAFLSLNFLNALPDMAAYFLLAAGTALWLWWRARRADMRPRSPLIAVNLGIAIGMVAGLVILAMSPGTSARAERHPLQFALSTAPETAVYQFTVFLREMMNVSNGLVLLAAVALGSVLALRVDATTHTSGLSVVRLRAIQALVLTGLLVFTGVLGETLTYGAVFHRWALLQVEFAAVMLIGLYLGYRFGTRWSSGWVSNASVAVICLALAASLIPLTNVTRLATDRLERWTSGESASVSFLEDREQPGLRDWWLLIDASRR